MNRNRECRTISDPRLGDVGAAMAEPDRVVLLVHTGRDRHHRIERLDQKTIHDLVGDGDVDLVVDVAVVVACIDAGMCWRVQKQRGEGHDSDH